MNKIPVKIVQYKINGESRKNVMIDMVDTYDIDGDVEAKIKDFKNKYFKIIKNVEKIFYGINEKKKYQNLPSSTYYKIGELLQKFNSEIKNEFEITNYTEAISRDFGLSKDYIYDLLTIVEIFKKHEIIDTIPFSYYRALKRKRNELEKLELFEKEKKRLNLLGGKKKLPGRENYKKELNTIVAKGKSLAVNG
jgi:hypothetical protein